MATILVIDDDESFRSMLRRTLQRAGYDVVEADEGAVGLRTLSGVSVDLVITDIIMPNMEGIETLRVLRRAYPDLKVIAMSGGGRIRADTYLDVAHTFGAFRTLAKPFDNAQLFSAVEDALR